MLRYDGASRTITTRMISKFSESTVPAPVVGAIPCGTPEEVEENIQEYVSLPVSLFGKGEFYILKASGDSMVDPESHSVILLYQNQERYPDKRILVKELTVQGVAQHVIKAL